MLIEKIQTKIYEIRGRQVMLDFDLAKMYDVETKVLNQAVKRNIERFPKDFMFRLTGDEWNDMRSQFVTASNQSKRNIKVTPYAFTEHGVTMLASILKSEKAVMISIQIVRAFVAMRTYLAELASTSKEIAELKNRIMTLEEQSEENQTAFDEIYLALSELAQKQKRAANPRNPIGFIQPKEKPV